MEEHFLQAMKIVHHHANGGFDWLISEHQSVSFFERSNFYTVWEIQMIYVCPSCADYVIQPPAHIMGKRKSFVVARQYRDCFSRRINPLVPRNYTEWKKLDYLRNKRSEISNVCNIVEDNCLQAMKIVHHCANGRFDWLISEHQSVNPSREVISILSGKHKRFTFVHPMLQAKTFRYKTFQFSLSLKSELKVDFLS